MADPPNANLFAHDAKKGVTAAAAIGMTALRPMMHFQVSMLRMWADSIERLADSFQKGTEETAATIEKRSDRERAA